MQNMAEALGQRGISRWRGKQDWKGELTSKIEADEHLR